MGGGLELFWKKYFCGKNRWNKQMTTRHGGNTADPEVKKVKLSISLVKYIKENGQAKTPAPPPSQISNGGPLIYLQLSGLHLTLETHRASNGLHAVTVTPNLNFHSWIGTILFQMLTLLPCLLTTGGQQTIVPPRRVLVVQARVPTEPWVGQRSNCFPRADFSTTPAGP